MRPLRYFFPLLVCTISGATYAQVPDGCNVPGPVLKIGNGVAPPVFLKGEEPKFPKAARKAKFSGEVFVSLVVDTNGRPRCTKVSKPVGLGLDEASIKAVQTYVFKPALKADGTPVPVNLIIAVSYLLY